MMIEERANEREQLGFLSYVFFAFLFLSAANIIGQYVIWLFMAFIVFLFYRKRVFRLTPSFVCLLVFSLFVLISNIDISNIVKAWVYPISYLVGISFLYKKKSFDQCLKYTHGVIYIFSAGTLLHFLLNYFSNVGSSYNTYERNTIDFWTGEALSATGQATLACMSIGVIAAWLFSDYGKTKKIAALIALAGIVLYNLILAGRTIFAMLIIAIGVAFFYRLKLKGTKKFRKVLLLLFVILLLLTAYHLDFLNIKSAVESSNFYQRFTSESIEEDSRFDNKLFYLQHFLDSFFGGDHIEEQLGHSAHDLYLDTYDTSGIFALIAIVAFVICSLRRLFYCIKSDTIPFNTKLLLLCVYLVINIQFFLEPIMEGMPWLLMYYAMIDGMVTAILIRDKST